MIHKYLCCYSFCLMAMSVLANNIKVENAQLSGQHLAQQYTMVNFDLSWENSWRMTELPGNWDAAWVFVKFRKPGEDWGHATLNYLDGTAAGDGHAQAPGSIIQTPSDGKGVFIYREQNGFGNNYWPVQLRWNYGVDGIGNQAAVEIKVFAIEMVYIPEGQFYLGGGNGSEVGKFYKWVSPLKFDIAYQVNSENAITIGNGQGDLYYPSPAIHDCGDQMGPIPAKFPKGFEAFYCMKYEVTQEQWIDFFNTLNADQKVNNDINDLDHKGPNTIDRNEVKWGGTGGAYTIAPNIPVTFVLWGEVLAYMDWAGLRPLTELEFIKASRGPLAPVAQGYAWGTANIIANDHIYDLIDKDEPSEQVVNLVPGTGNANWIKSSIFEDGPYRAGIFAASAAHNNRQETGATYYGVMEMSGNVGEMCITIGSPEGRDYRGGHGDGILTPDGEADVASWPPIDGSGGGLFGGAWFSEPEELRINDRRSATNGNVGYFNDVGFRCVRTAP